MAKFDLIIQVGKTGTPEGAHPEKQSNELALWLMRLLRTPYTANETPFPSPPGEHYKILLEIDPATLKASP